MKRYLSRRRQKWKDLIKEMHSWFSSTTLDRIALNIYKYINYILTYIYIYIFSCVLFCFAALGYF